MTEKEVKGKSVLRFLTFEEETGRCFTAITKQCKSDSERQWTLAQHPGPQEQVGPQERSSPTRGGHTAGLPPTAAVKLHTQLSARSKQAGHLGLHPKSFKFKN